VNEDPPAVRDRTRQHEIREALRRRDEQFSRLIASAPGLICSFLMRADGSTAMPFASPAIEDIYGLTPEQVARDATPVLARIHPDDLPGVQRAIEESSRTMSPWRAEYRYQHPTKGERWLEGRSAPQREPDVQFART
jgi:PAS domain-containing protein